MDLQTEIDYLKTRCHVLQIALVGVLQAAPKQFQLPQRISAALETAEIAATEGDLRYPPSIACPDLVELFKVLAAHDSKNT